MKRSLKNLRKGKDSWELNAIIERDDDGFFTASVLELPGCKARAKSLDTLEKRLRKAIDHYLEDHEDEPHPSRFVGVYRITI